MTLVSESSLVSFLYMFMYLYPKLDMMAASIFLDVGLDSLAEFFKIFKACNTMLD